MLGLKRNLLLGLIVAVPGLAVSLFKPELFTRATGYLGLQATIPTTQGLEPPEESYLPQKLKPQHLKKNAVLQGVKEGEKAAVATGPEPGATDKLLLALRQGFKPLLDNLIRVSRVHVTGNYHLSNEDVLRALQIEGRPWIFQNLNQGFLDNLSKNPWLASASASWEAYPLALHLQVREEEPWLVAQVSGKSWLIARSGKILQPLEALKDGDMILQTTELPRLEDELKGSSDKILSPENARFQYAVDLLKLLDAAGGVPFAVERFTLLENGGVAITPLERKSAARVLFDAQNFSEAAQKISQLKVVMADISKRGEGSKQIDLRFKNQVVVQ